MPKVVYYVENDDNTLSHYGRLGMKWGQHIFGREHAVHKALKTLSKYDNKLYKTSKKVVKNMKKSRRYVSIGDSQNAVVITNPKYEKKVKKYDAKFNKRYEKAKEFVKNANEILGSGSISNLSEKDMALAVALGRQFTLEFAKSSKN